MSKSKHAHSSKSKLELESDSNSESKSESESESESFDDPFYIEVNPSTSDSDSGSDEPDITIEAKSSIPKLKKRVTKSKSKNVESDLNLIIDSTAKLSISKKRLTNERKTIYLDGDPAKPVTAAGVILYRYVGKEMQLLLINSRNKYEDIGGKIDQIDDSIEEAAAREVEEETNGQIDADSIIDRLSEAGANQKIYVKNSKYLIYLIRANNEERAMTKDVFGDYEDHDRLKRTIQWMPRKTIFSPTFIRGGKLNYRMRSKSLKTALENLEKNKKYTKSLFH